MNTPPFRWNVARREQLGSLLDVNAAEGYAGFIDDLRECTVKVLALAAESDVVFVGRSPESIFDYLSGVLSHTRLSDRCVLLNLSIRRDSIQQILRDNPGGFRALQDQLTVLGLAPYQIERSERPKVFVDLVCRGYTFSNLAGLISYWTAATNVDLRAVRRRVRFIGITERTKNSPNTWRWYQHGMWAADFPRSALRSVSIPRRLWNYLGGCQQKVARSYPPLAWGDEEFSQPPREESNLEALRLAARLYDMGSDPAERGRFAAKLFARPEIADRALRKIAAEIRSTSSEA